MTQEEKINQLEKRVNKLQHALEGTMHQLKRLLSLNDYYDNRDTKDDIINQLHLLLCSL